MPTSPKPKQCQLCKHCRTGRHLKSNNPYCRAKQLMKSDDPKDVRRGCNYLSYIGLPSKCDECPTKQQHHCNDLIIGRM